MCPNGDEIFTLFIMLLTRAAFKIVHVAATEGYVVEQ